MKRPLHFSIRVSLEMGMIAFFILAALSLLVVYLADPSIYAHSLALTSSPADRYPVPVTLFLVGVLVLIALLILGVVRHWRWLFWLLLVAFAGSVLQIPVTLLQMTDVLPSSDPLWYSLFRMGGGMVELALAAWMIFVYRREGVWAQGAKRHSWRKENEPEHHKHEFGSSLLSISLSFQQESSSFGVGSSCGR